MKSAKPAALVIGASRGIGRQIAIDLARNGYAGISISSSLDAHTLNKPFNLKLLPGLPYKKMQKRTRPMECSPANVIDSHSSSNALRQNDLRPEPNNSLSPRPQLLLIYHQHRRARDSHLRRHCRLHRRRRARLAANSKRSGRDPACLWTAGRPRLQLRGDLVVLRGGYTPEKVQADAAGQSRGTVCKCTGGVACV